MTESIAEQVKFMDRVNRDLFIPLPGHRNGMAEGGREALASLKSLLDGGTYVQDVRYADFAGAKIGKVPLPSLLRLTEVWLQPRFLW